MTRRLCRRRLLTLGCGAALTVFCVGCGPAAEQIIRSDGSAEAAESAQAAQGMTEVPDTEQATGPVRTACPRGMVNDPYPGRCRMYVDRNGSGYCDLSEATA